METLQLQNTKLTWLRGGVNFLDGGAMFGVVPKPLWSKKYPCNEKNQIELRTDPILIQAEGKNILVDSGLGNGKLTEKQRRNFGALEESQVVKELAELNIKPLEIDYVLMTHLHFDHACGLTSPNNETYNSVFPNAKIIVSKTEWDEMRNPNIRSRNTYWKENWEPIQDQVTTFDKEWSLGSIQMVHTGGHSDGHSIIIIEDGDDFLIHMGDIMPTHAHQNVLWVLAYDDYPMNSIWAKDKWIHFGLENNAWFTFYHDAYYRAVKWDKDGKLINKLDRIRKK
ncbi:MBL fold metallo-hydrolase [Bacillus sp. DTU_2020_1000418_1_SI_GHA_SEK_038]|uniref:YtnP family quorum-quenching lactonase n=1 Tax=Bacillus sp. DTU_2020_1000418_1_SI_GHA_SEK_038 TaxID=3077585 RepID=UPI0028EA93A2|nr:MBL fold metallo-hydrolase [Bacillus sp. DTU_2020_1000418_1_SI_GHA_SEK_038]WNS74644.1 MBL fold metallo-hydrolase [Bacillus sp. DTU_2020_1000418_1_SI_GHA_SEK_038]